MQDIGTGSVLRGLYKWVLDYARLAQAMHHRGMLTKFLGCWPS